MATKYRPLNWDWEKKYGTSHSSGYYYHTVTSTDNTTDSVTVTYPCGHAIGVPGTAYRKGLMPPRCVTCEQQQLAQKWVHQQEAKLWREDPKWPGFPPYTNASVSASGMVEPPHPIAWLDFQIEKVRRRAFA